MDIRIDRQEQHNEGTEHKQEQGNVVPKELPNFYGHLVTISPLSMSHKGPAFNTLPLPACQARVLTKKTIGAIANWRKLFKN
jgi:hypothetical protein